MKHLPLAKLQSEFKQYLFAGANEAVLSACVAATRDIDAVQRLDIYRNAYYIRLQEALAHDFPLLLSVLGDAEFGREMAAYLQAHPSTELSLGYVGQYLPGWFYSKNQIALADLARLEWAVLRALDAADAHCLDGDRLKDIPPERWSRLRFRLHPSVTLLDVESNVLNVWTARAKNSPSPGLRPDAPASLVVSRVPRGVSVSPISPHHHTFLEALAENHSFGSACELLAQGEPVETVPRIAAQCLSRALAHGWLADMHE